jgi:hypothetical protein
MNSNGSVLGESECMQTVGRACIDGETLLSGHNNFIKIKMVLVSQVDALFLTR